MRWLGFTHAYAHTHAHMHTCVHIHTRRMENCNCGRGVMWLPCPRKPFGVLSRELRKAIVTSSWAGKIIMGRHETTGPSMKPLLISLREAPDAFSDGQAPQPPPAVGALRWSLRSPQQWRSTGCRTVYTRLNLLLLDFLECPSSHPPLEKKSTAVVILQYQ